MSDAPSHSTRRVPAGTWPRLAVAVATVAGAVLVVRLLHGGAVRALDDAAWSVVLHHRRWIWVTLTDLVSAATPTVGGGLALLGVATVVSLRSGRREPLVVAVAALVLLIGVVAGGKLLSYQGDVAGPAGLLLPGPRFPSGPATTAVVVGGMGARLLWGCLRPVWYRGFVVLVSVVVAANGLAEVYLGQHRLTDVVASWVVGVAVVVVVLALGGPAVARAAAEPPAPLRDRSAHLLARSPLARPVYRAHARLALRSGGRIGLGLLDGSRLLVLEFVTRSGRLRRVPVGYVEHPDGFVATVVTTGSDRTPSWLLDLRAADSAVVYVRGEAAAVVPLVADGARRDELRAYLLRRCPAAAGYAHRVGREPPVVVVLLLS